MHAASSRALVLSVCIWLGCVSALPAAQATTEERAPEPTGQTEPTATDIPLTEPVLYDTATVRARVLDTATASVTVLDRDWIERSGLDRTEELLAFVPGVTLVDGATRGGLTTAQIRGGDPSFTRVLVDGVPVEDATYQVGGVFDLEAMPLGAVERIEVVRGPLSHRYGSTGLAGAIQLVTRRGSDAPAVSARAELGDADLLRLSLALAGGDEDLDGFLSLSSDEEEGRIADESFDMLHLQAKSHLRTGERSELRLALRAADWSAADYPDASGGPVFGSGEPRSADHEELGAGARWDLRRDRQSYRLELGSYRHDMERESPAVLPLVPPSVESTRFTRVRGGASASFDLSARGGVQLGLGVEIETEDGDNESILLLPPFLGGAVSGDYDLSRDRAGVYAQATGFRDRLTWELAARVDEPDDGGRQFSPRLGLAWRLEREPSADSTTLRVGAGRAYQEPSFFALASPRALGGNPDLVSETAVGGDVGLRRDLHRLDLSYGATYFRHRYEDLVDFDFATFLHVNRSRVDAEGIETFLEWRPRSQLFWTAQATWQDVENVDTGEPLRHRPEWSGAVQLVWRATPALRLAGDLRFVGEQVDEQIPVPERTRVDGYELLGLGAGWQSANGWRLAARVDNLLDESYETLIGFPGAGRSFRASVGWSARP